MPPGDSQAVDVLATPGEAASYLLPHDEIIVRCGASTHQAVVWSVDRERGRLLLLEPFAEFWDACRIAVERIPYRYERELTGVSWSQVQPILVAAITIRDRR
jgi:hypothetical protein